MPRPRARNALWISVATGLLLAAASPAATSARVRCSSGVTVVRDGRLKVIGTIHHTGEFDLYVCLGGHRPVQIGDATAQVLTFDGVRYMAELVIRTGGEGPADATYYVADIRAVRDLTWAESVDSFDEITPFRVTAAGALVRDDYGIQVIRPGFKGDARLIKPIGSGSDIAYTGATVYWTDGPSSMSPAARSATVKAPARVGENRVYDLRRMSSYASTYSRGRCPKLRGTIVAASPHVRVIARPGGARRACALGKGWTRAIAPGALRITGDRWLLSRTAGGARVIDGLNGAVVTSVADPGITGWTLAGDGTLAWLAADGRLLGQAPLDDGPTVLAEAATAPTLLASSDSTIYWTSSGAPGRWAR